MEHEGKGNDGIVKVQQTSVKTPKETTAGTVSRYCVSHQVKVTSTAPVTHRAH